MTIEKLAEGKVLNDKIKYFKEQMEMLWYIEKLSKERNVLLGVKGSNTHIDVPKDIKSGLISFVKATLQDLVEEKEKEFKKL